MEQYKHWAEALEIGDRVKATIRHETDNSKNIIDIEVIVAANIRKENKIIGTFEDRMRDIPYMDIRTPVV